MYEDILGSAGNVLSWATIANLHFVLTLIMFVLMLVIVQGHKVGVVDLFSNLEDTIRSKHDQTASLPVLDERSLRQKLGESEQRARDAMAADAAAVPVSTLTGTRDIPVFYQDYNIDASKKQGAVAQAREGFTGAISQDDLENMLLKNKN